MVRVLLAGFFYFAIVFVFAFALGTVRTLLLEPRIGELYAVLCEAPFLIAAMLFAAQRAQRWTKLPARPAQLIAMGMIGLVFQQGAEFGLVLSAGETVAQHLAYLQTPPGMIYVGLLFVFALLPLLLHALRTKPN